MEIDKYRQIVKNLIIERSQTCSVPAEIEKQAIIDTEGDHYLLLHTGWRDNNRMHGCSIHIDIKDGKIWIQYDGTEVGMSTLLVEQGVPKEDIVLAFHSPYMRQFTEFATH